MALPIYERIVNEWFRIIATMREMSEKAQQCNTEYYSVVMCHILIVSLALCDQTT